MRRIWTWTIALLLALSILPGTAKAAEVVAEGTCGAEGENLTWALDHAGTLSISGNGAMTDFDMSGNLPPWYGHNLSINRITVDKGVTSIGSHSFYGFSELTSVILPDSVTRIGSNAFHNCNQLTEMHLPENLTYIGDSAFSLCRNLQNIFIPGSVAYIGQTPFAGCNNLDGVWVHEDNLNYVSDKQGVLYTADMTELICAPGKLYSSYVIPETVRIIGQSAFYECSRITDIDVPDSVTTIENSTFRGCSSLSAISLPSGLTSIGYGAFWDCTGLKCVDIPDGVTSIGDYAFYRCDSMVCADIPSSVTVIGRCAFSGCSSLTSVLIPTGVSIIDDYAFLDCTALTSISIPSTVTFLGDGPFMGCIGIVEICVDEGNTVYASDSFGVVYSKDMAELLIAPCALTSSYSISDTVTRIGRKAFAGCSGIVEIDIPSSVTEIGECAFELCSNLESVEIPASVTCIGYMAFENCSRLTTVELDANINSIEHRTFYGCGDLQNISLPNTLERIEDHVFSECDSLTSIRIPPKVNYLGYSVFYGSDNLKYVVFFGDAPIISHIAFSGVTMDAYYPLENETWPTVIAGNYGGTVTWKPYIDADVFRVAGADRISTSFRLADQLKQTLGVEKFDTMIVASALNFPDALTGSYLAAVKTAPILLTYEAAHGQVQAYIEANLRSGGTVYILGGESAVSAGFQADLTSRGMNVKRLAGSDRFGTNLKILEEAGVTSDQEILICTATGFADSLSASAAGLPILLVHGSLTVEQKTFLEGTSKKFVIIGGESAVPAAIENELKAMGEVTRLGGASRYQTSVMVAERFVQNPDAVVLAYARNYPDGLCGGPLAIALNAPLILTDNYDPSVADSYVDGISAGVVVGGTGLISDATARDIFDLTADAPIQ